MLFSSQKEVYRYVLNQLKDSVLVTSVVENFSSDKSENTLRNACFSEDFSEKKPFNVKTVYNSAGRRTKSFSYNVLNLTEEGLNGLLIRFSELIQEVTLGGVIYWEIKQLINCLKFCIKNFSSFENFVEKSFSFGYSIFRFKLQQLERMIKYFQRNTTRYRVKGTDLTREGKFFQKIVRNVVSDFNTLCDVDKHRHQSIFKPNYFYIFKGRKLHEYQFQQLVFTFENFYYINYRVNIFIGRNSSKSDIELNPGPGDTTKAIDNAFVAYSLEMAQPYAVESFRAQMKNALECDIPNLSKSDTRYIEEMLGYSVNFSALGKPNTSEHVLLAAFRNITRCAMKRSYNPVKSNLRTCFVGASFREYQENKVNPNCVYHFYDGQVKDYARTTLNFQQEFLNLIKMKGKREKTLYEGDVNYTRMATKTYDSIQDLTIDFNKLNNKENRFFFDKDIPNANVLIFEDCIYDMTKSDYLDYFEKSQATMGFGYALMPLEFVHERVYDFELYDLEQRGGKTELLYRYGQSNGYSHNTQNWKRLFDEPVMKRTKFSPVLTKKEKCKTFFHGAQRTGNGFNLVVEITGRYGPFVTFTISRTNIKEEIVRQLELPKQYRCYEVADLLGMYNNYHKSLRSSWTGKVKRIQVQATEYNEIKNYLGAIADKSMTVENADAYMKKRISGASLVDKALLYPWYLKERDLISVALTMTIREIKLRETKVSIIEYFNNSALATLFNLITRAFKWLVTPIASVLAWAVDFFSPLYISNNLVDETDHNSWKMTQRIFTDSYTEKVVISIIPCFPEGEDDNDCPLCAKLGDLGEQVITCKHIKNSKHTFKMSEDDLKAIEVSLIDNDMDPVGIKTVKERAKAAMPKTSFTWECEIFLISAGPGNGKSWVARKLLERAHKINTKALVLAPFTKLKMDYSNAVTDTGECYEVAFKTTHRAMETAAYEELHLDEWTSFPYEMLSLIAYNNCAKRIYLYGDEKQTKLQEPNEGKYIGNYIDLKNVSQHTLHKNFRNPQDIVALLNKKYGYDSYATSKIQSAISFRSLADFQQDKTKGFNIMHFADQTAKIYGLEENTVRKNQGQTCDVAGLVFSKHDYKLIEDSAMQIVALTRHKKLLVLYASPDCKIFRKFLNLTGISEDYYSANAEFAFPSLPRATMYDEVDDEFSKMFMDKEKFDNTEKDEEEEEKEEEVNVLSNTNLLKPGITKSNLPSSSTEYLAMMETIEQLSYKLNYLEESVLDNSLEFFETPNTVLSILANYFERLYVGGTIADFGTGTGVIAKMLIEKFFVKVDGFDIRERESIYKNENFRFFERDLTKQTNLDYDFVISNMPFGANRENRENARKFLKEMIDSGKKVLFINTANFTNYLDKTDINYEVLESFDFPLKKTYAYQTKESLNIPCSIYYVSNSIDDHEFSIDLFDNEEKAICRFDHTYNGVYIFDYQESDVKLTEDQIDAMIKVVNNNRNVSCMYLLNGCLELYSQEKMLNFIPFPFSYSKHVGIEKNIIIKGDINSYNDITSLIKLEEENYKKKEEDEKKNGKIQQKPKQDFFHPAINCKLCGISKEHRSKHCNNVDCANAKRPVVFKKVETCAYCSDFKNFSKYTNDCALHAIAQATKQPLKRIIQLAHSLYSCQRLMVGNFSANFIAELIANFNAYGVFITDTSIDCIGYKKNEKTRPLFFFLKNKHWTFRREKKLVLEKLSLPVLNQPGLNYSEMVGGRFIKQKLDEVNNFENLNDFSPTEKQSFYQHATTYHDFTNWTENTAIKVEQNEIVQPEYQCLYDAYKLDIIPNQILAEENTSYNYYNGMRIQSDFQTGTLDYNQYLAPLNSKGHPRQEKSFFSLGFGLGNSFSSAHNGQVLQVIQDRYIGSVKNFKLTLDGRQLARRIAKNFFDVAIDREKILASLDDESVAKLSEQMLKDCYSKSYPAQFNIANEFSARNISFHLKEIFKSKISLKEEYTEKAGQGISAWSKPAQTTFMINFRILNHVFLQSLKKNVIFNNGYTIQDLSSRVDHVMNFLPSDGILNATTDMTAFDKYQNSFTQEIEKQFWLLLGVCEEFVEHYYSFRHDYKIVCDIVRALVKSAKTSGEPATLINNTLLSLCLICWLFTGQGPMIIIAQGDDGFRRQANLVFLQQRYDELMLHVPLKIKCLISEESEFCGYSIFKGAIVPSLPRRLNKILGQRYRDYKHFCEYQTAIRDFIDDVKFLDPFFVILKNAEMWKVTFNEMHCIYDCIVSFGHINKEQFFKMAKLKVEDYAILNLYGR